jgi:hypothetical protein
VAQNASGRTGLDPALLKKMLPILAMMVAGYMARQQGGGTQAGAGGGLGGLLGGLLGGNAPAPGGPGVPGRARTGGLADMLDMNNDGNALDDIIRMGGKLMR